MCVTYVYDDVTYVIPAPSAHASHNEVRTYVTSSYTYVTSSYTYVTVLVNTQKAPLDSDRRIHHERSLATEIAGGIRKEIYFPLYFFFTRNHPRTVH